MHVYSYLKVGFVGVFRCVSMICFSAWIKGYCRSPLANLGDIFNTFSEMCILYMPCPKLQLETFTEGTYIIGTNWASTRENMSSGLVNNKCADQHAHPRSLISAFVFAHWKVLYLDLLRAKFQLSS